jgi:hypothetical protein
MSETQTHPDLLAIGRRLGNLALSRRLTQNETDLALFGMMGIGDIRLAFWDDLKALAGHPLPDPGCRPSGPEVFAFLDDPDASRDSALAFGYLHRVREFADRLEAKYELGEDAA